MRGTKGEMNVDFSDVYDQEDDIYYVSFKSGEPSYVIEMDDILLLEVGMFTNMPTGFRILNFKKNKVAAVRILAQVKKNFEDVTKKHLSEELRSREDQVERTLDKVFA